MSSSKQTLAWVDHDGTVRPLHHPSRTEILQKLARAAHKTPRDHVQRVRSYLADADWYWRVRNPGTDRTTYIIGLFGTGRFYLNALILQHVGARAKYFRHAIRIRSGPTSMIYSGHATISHVSRAQVLPAVTSRILQAVRARTADLIFIYRHPLDSLITNWVWWRTYMRDRRMISSISQVYSGTNDLCADLDRHFSDFKAFVDADPAFFASLPGTPFLSFSEFVEETALFCQSATLAVRLEDFAVDPVNEFAKVVDVMSADVDVSRLQLAPPRAKPYAHLAVKAMVPRFRDFIAGLPAEAKRQIEGMGYTIDDLAITPRRSVPTG